MNMRQIEPTRYSRHRIMNVKWVSDDPAIGCQADKAEQRRPSEPDPFGTGQAFVPPLTGTWVDSRIGVMRVNEDVDVGQDHVALPVEA
jgi:hypothetical protein